MIQPPASIARWLLLIDWMKSTLSSGNFAKTGRFLSGQARQGVRMRFSPGRPSVTDLFPLCPTTQRDARVLDRSSFAARVEGPASMDSGVRSPWVQGNKEMDDSAQRLRSHIQVI